MKNKQITFKIKDNCVARNAQLTSGGDFVNRQGYYGLDIFDSSARYLGAFTLQEQGSGESIHYFLIADSNFLNGKLVSLKEDLTLIHELTIPSLSTQSVLSFANLANPSIASLEMLVGIPDVPMIYGVVGGSTEYATSAPSVNPNTTAISTIPSGLTTAFAGRAVIATSNAILFSDTRSPRTFTGINQSGLPGFVYGLHTLPSGDLIIATTTGFFKMPVEAATQGQSVLGIFDKFSNFAINSYQSSCVYGNQVFALTSKGIVEVGSSTYLNLGDPILQRGLSKELNLGDYRSSKLFSWSKGIILATDTGACFIDLEENFISWYTSDLDTGILTGICEDNKGIVLLAFRKMLVVLNSNFDYDVFEDETHPIQFNMSARFDTPPEASPQVRRVTASSSSDNVSVAVNGQIRETTIPLSYPVLNQDVWTADGDGYWTQNTLRSRRFDFVVRTDDITVEVASQPVINRIRLHPDIHIEFKGFGKTRPTN